MATITPVAEVSLATYTPGSATGHSIKIRAKKASGVGTVTINAALYEGTTNRSGDLASSAITTSLADYTLAISDGNAATILDRSNLSIKFWGASSTSDTVVVSVAEVDLIVPQGAANQVPLVGVSLTGSQSSAVPFVEVPSLQGVSLTGSAGTGTLTLASGGPAVLAPSAAAKAAAATLLIAAGQLSPAARSAGAASAQLVLAEQLSPAAASAAAAIAVSTVANTTLFAATAGSASAAAVTVRRTEPLSPLAASASTASAAVSRLERVTPSAQSLAHASVDLAVPRPTIPYVFDAIVILDGASNQVAEIARSLGPLESGYVNGQGTWTPAEDPVAVIVDGFGIDAFGNAYYDTQGVDRGDEAALFVDPAENLLWLQS